MPEKDQTESARTAEATTPQSVFSGHISDQTAVEYIMSIRSAERVRIARHLHDNTSQLLAVLQLNLGRIRRQGSNGCEAIIAECEEMVAQIGHEIREICSRSPS